MSKIEIDIIVSGIESKYLETHESGNKHLKVVAHPNTRGKHSHIIFIDNKFHGFANIVEDNEQNNCIELPAGATIDDLPF